MSRISVGWIIGSASVLLSAALIAGSTFQEAPTSAILLRYARGESVDEAISSHFRTSAAFNAFLRDIEREARKVPAPAIAAFSLHAASLAFDQAPMAAGSSGKSTALAILEVGCSKLRATSQRPSPFEVRWQVFAADLITSSTGRKGGSAETFHMNAHLPYDSHFKHVLERGGSDPALALRFARYEQAQFYIWRLTHGVAVVRAEGGLSSRVARRYEAVQRLDVVLSRLEPLTTHADFAEEARVRSGDALLHLGRDADALQLLGDSTFKNGNWEYVRRLLRARSYIRSGLPADAAREYEAALVITPRARPAKLALAALTYLAGQRDVAERLQQAESEGSESDPWVAYMYPGAEDWIARLDAFRKEALGGQ